MNKLNNRRLILSIALGILVPGAVLASNLTIPNVFSAGSPIRASEVNANFAAVQTALNSKLDASTTIVRSGTRIQAIGIRTADGLVVQDPGYVFFDTVKNTRCQPLLATDGKVRCIPLGNSYAFNQAAQEYYFSDSTCLSTSYLFEATSYPIPSGQLGSGAFTLVAQGSPARYSVNQLVQYFGALYASDQPGSGCHAAAAVGRTLYTPGPAVPPADFQEMTYGLL